MPLADFGFNRMQNVLFVSEETLADPARAAAVKAFLAASGEGWKSTLAAPAEGVAVIMSLFGDSLGLKQDEQARILDAMVPFLTRTEQTDKSQFWMGEGLIKETVDNLGAIGVKADAATFTNELLG